MKERILCAAIWFDDGKEYDHQPINIKTGYVICGHRHHNCFMTAGILDPGISNYQKHEKEQGFVTNTNRFVSREEASEIALKSGQVSTVIKRLQQSVQNMLSSLRERVKSGQRITMGDLNDMERKMTTNQ